MASILCMMPGLVKAIDYFPWKTNTIETYRRGEAGGEDERKIGQLLQKELQGGCWLCAGDNKRWHHI
jgi:hypothetical protein